MLVICPRLPRPQSIVAHVPLTVSYPMGDIRVSEWFGGAFPLVLAVAPVLLACAIRHGPASRLNDEGGEDRTTLIMGSIYD